MAKGARTDKTKHVKPKADAAPKSRTMSPAKRKALRRAAELQIDKFMKRVGYTNPSERIDGDGWRWFEYGSARGRAGIVESGSDRDLFLRAESLVMKLPADQDAIFHLMHDLLQANMNIAGSARLGISGESIFACSTAPVVELAPGDIATHIHSVMALAASFVNPSGEQVKQPVPVQEEIQPESMPDPSPQAA